MKGVLPWLVRWACRASTRDFCPCLGCSSRPSTIYLFPHRTLFHFICPHRPENWAGSRAALLLDPANKINQCHSLDLGISL
jgi:hypothetical protein